MKPTYIVDLHGVTHGYGNKVVLNDINLHIREGEFVTIVGPSGCGKSTLFRLMTGEETPWVGAIHIQGKPKTRPGPDVGIVYQNYAIFPHLTVAENIAFGPILHQTSLLERLLFRYARSYKEKSARIRKDAENILGVVKLGDAHNKYPHELSGGMQQRVSIAQALMMDHPVLLMDEPFGALDELTREQIQLDLLKTWQERRATILFVTHEIEEALFLGTRIIVLSQHYWSGNKEFDLGARIVMDLPITPPHPRPPEFKDSQQMGDMLNRIRHGGAFSRTATGESLHVGKFALEHPDSVGFS